MFEDDIGLLKDMESIIDAKMEDDTKITLLTDKIKGHNVGIYWSICSYKI